MTRTTIISVALVFAAFIAVSWAGGRLIDAVSSYAVVTGRLGIAAYVAIVALNAVVVAPIGAIPLIPLAVQLWGEMPTALMNIAGWTIGSVIAFVIARYFGRPYMERLVGAAALQRMERYIPKERLFVTVVLLRMMLPVDLLSYALGALSPMRFFPYALATLIGVAPFAFVFSYGTTLPLAQQLVGAVVVVALIIVVNTRYMHNSLMRQSHENIEL